VSLENLLTPPDELYGLLFHDVQTGGLFADSKTFVDAVARQDPARIVAQYMTEKDRPGFDLSAFVDAHFDLPEPPADDFVTDTSLTTAEHIDRLWPRLTRPGDGPAETLAVKPGDSRLPLPRPYVVPGGRFRELFYWDSYFTMLGLRESGRVDLIRDMIENFAYLTDTYGRIPNGNRTYFLSRSQPPFFALMVQLLADIDGPDVLARYLPSLQTEHEFWGCDRANFGYADDQVLAARPRPEAYREELVLAGEAADPGSRGKLFLDVRAACESGWDFSSRWLTDGRSLTTLHTSDIRPVDWACLVYTQEKTLEMANARAGDADRADAFAVAVREREAFIPAVHWNNETGFFHDFDGVRQQHTPHLTLAGVFPLFANVATSEQAARVHDRLKRDFLQAGGWVTTLVHSGQQWDWPNGWAPLQWIVYRGLMNYGFADTARIGRDRWLALNDRVFRETGKLMEKYNVVEANLTAGGGEYPNQDGFGWTNGVYLALLAEKQRELSPASPDNHPGQIT
jgi:alpha,alpha-trehalase